MELAIDRSSNVIVIDGHPVGGRRRWEAAVLALLISGRHDAAATAASAKQIDAHLASAGQSTPLTRKQWALLWQSVKAMFATAGAEQALSRRLHHAPRGATVGPWWWEPGPADQIEIVGTPVVAADMPLPGLSAAGRARSAAALCQRFLIAQGLISDGDLQAASDALADDARWRDTTPETQALRLVRLGEVELLRRNFLRARSAAEQAARVAATSEVAQAYLGAHVALLENRIDYAHRPVDDAGRIRSRLAPLIRRPASARHMEVDPLSRGLTLNLAALCERRWIEQHVRDVPTRTLMRCADTALAYWSAALFGFLVCNQHEHVHNMCSNVGYLFQRLCELRVADCADVALEWYGLAQAWHNRFDLPDSTVWEYVFLGDFWLGSQGVRALLAEADFRTRWAGRHPGTADFYAYSAQRAREIGDPRQIAHTAFNLWRFSREQGQIAAMRQARADLEQTLAEHPDLRALLTAEGYVLPESGRQTFVTDVPPAQTSHVPVMDHSPDAAQHG